MNVYRIIRHVLLAIQTAAFGILFVLKLNEVGDFAALSWWWVSTTLYGPFALVLLLFAGAWLHGFVLSLFTPNSADERPINA